MMCTRRNWKRDLSFVCWWNGSLLSEMSCPACKSDDAAVSNPCSTSCIQIVTHFLAIYVYWLCSFPQRSSEVFEQSFRERFSAPVSSRRRGRSRTPSVLPTSTIMFTTPTKECAGLHGAVQNTWLLPSFAHCLQRYGRGRREEGIWCRTVMLLLILFPPTSSQLGGVSRYTATQTTDRSGLLLRLPAVILFIRRRTRVEYAYWVFL